MLASIHVFVNGTMYVIYYICLFRSLFLLFRAISPRYPELILRARNDKACNRYEISRA